MYHGQLVLIADERDHAQAQALLDSALVAWPNPSLPTIRTVTCEQVLSPQFSHSRIDTAWLYAGPHIVRGNLYAVLDTLQNLHIPTLLTRLGETQPSGATIREGVIAAPADSQPAHFSLLLASTIAQGQLVRQIRGELSLAQRHQRGLAHQIDQLDEELRLAARIQRQFLPTKLPTLGDVSFGVLFRPAGYVSGDIYDVMRLDEDHLGFYVADAVGHGVPAALLTMFLKQALRTREITPGGYRIIPPDEALAGLNHSLLKHQSVSTQFITACYGTVNVKTRQLQLARGGHPAPLLLSRDNQVRPLSPTGPLLGVFEDEPFDLLTTTLDHGDRLLLYTDGFEVAFGDHLTNTSRYLDILKNLRHGTLDQAMSQLGNLLDDASGSLHQADDLTALMVDLAPTHHPAAAHEENLDDLTIATIT
jgi:sigma-B regulation protein RsbU (phosphoserine phosphatase)